MMARSLLSWGGFKELVHYMDFGDAWARHTIIAAGADVNAAGADGGQTALQAAAEGGHLEIVEKLLETGADVNAAAAGYGGRTALQAAAWGGYLEVVEKLLTAGADVNAAAAAGDYGRTALQAAAEGGDLEVINRLKEAGALR